MGFLRDFIQGAAQATPGAVENANIHAEQAKLNAIRQQTNTIQENTNTQLQEIHRQNVEMNRTKGIMDNFFSVLSIADPTKRAPALDFLARQGEQSGAGVPKETLSLLKKLTKDEAIALENAYNDFSAQNPSIMMTPDFFRTAMSDPSFVAKFLSDKAEKAEREQTNRSLQGGTSNTGIQTPPQNISPVTSQNIPVGSANDSELSKLRAVEQELITRGSPSDLKILVPLQKRIASLEQRRRSPVTANIDDLAENLVKELGTLPKTSETLSELSGAGTGPVSSFLNLFNKTIGAAGVPIAKETAKARQSFQLAGINLTQSLSNNSRYPEGLRKWILKQTSISPSFFTSPKLMRTNLEPLNNFLKQSIEVEKIVFKAAQTDAAKQEALNNLSALVPFQRDLGVDDSVTGEAGTAEFSKEKEERLKSLIGE